MSIQTQVTPTNVPLAHASTRATDEVALQDNLADHNELAIARAFLATMQMYCTSLEPKRGLGQGADFSVLAAINYAIPHAKSLHDIGVPAMSAADVTRAMLADLNSLKGGSVFDATQVDSFCNETSERNTFGDGYNLRSARDPIGYTRATPDPKHHGQAMRSPMRTEWIKSQGLEMQGLWSRGVFQKVLRTSLTPQDKVFSTRFHYKIKRKGGEFDKCKV